MDKRAVVWIGRLYLQAWFLSSAYLAVFSIQVLHIPCYTSLLGVRVRMLGPALSAFLQLFRSFFLSSEFLVLRIQIPFTNFWGQVLNNLGGNHWQFSNILWTNISLLSPFLFRLFRLWKVKCNGETALGLDKGALRFYWTGLRGEKLSLLAFQKSHSTKNDFKIEQLLLKTHHTHLEFQWLLLR